MENGVLYVATGDEYIKEATRSAKQTRRHMDVPIAIIADQHPNSEVFDEIIIDSDPKFSSVDKPRNLLKSPFEKTLYLDCDAFVLDSVSELFQLLDYYELLIATDPNEAGKVYNSDENASDLPKSLPIFQTGVVAYRNSKSVEILIETWTDTATNNNYKYEQTAFRESIYKHDIKWMTISHLYNCLIKWPMQVTGDVKIIHGHLGNINKYEVDKIDEIVNSDVGPRLLYYPERTNIRVPTSVSLDIVVKQSPKIFNFQNTVIRDIKLLKENYRQHGLIETFKRGIRYLSP